MNEINYLLGKRYK